MERQIKKEDENLTQKLHGLSALLFLYQTKPDKYSKQIQQIQEAMTKTVSDLYSQKKEKEMLSAIGPLLLSSIIPALPEESELANYIKIILELEPESGIFTTKELISEFENVFVILGKKASGKGTVSNIMNEDHGIKGMPTSNWLRGIARAHDSSEPFNSIMLRELADKLREKFGSDVLVWLTLQEFYLKGYPNIAFDGLRSEGELKNLMGKRNVSLIWVEASDDKRLERIISRGRQGDPTTVEKLLEVDRLSFPEAESIKNKCGCTISNMFDDTESLRQEVYELVNPLEIAPLKVIETI